MNPPPVKRHFSMIRDFHLADFLTLANGLCGVVAIFQALHFVKTGELRAIYLAAALIPLALVFDVLDGRVARSRGLASPLGRELDSLADVISFGVAPAAIAYGVGLVTVVDQIVLGFFVLCGLSRLARYNVSAAASTEPQGKVRYFEGTPIPTSVVPLAVLMAAFHFQHLYPMRIDRIEFHLPVVLFFISGCLMISKTIRIPKP
jgi:CDP-diacylglycerol---serine O-phosphatidyltransferase